MNKPDYRALIAKMAYELDQCQQQLLGDHRERHPLADHARAALAEPESIQDRIAAADAAIEASMERIRALAAPARAALAESEAVGPRGRPAAAPVPEPGEVMELVEFLQRHGTAQEAADTHWAKPLLRAATLLSQRHPTPVPVSERLPGPEDCDEQGRCWLGGHQMGSGTPTWLLGYPAWAERFPDVHRFWLPANALPLPAPEGREAQH